jgi:hypothetical protein
MIFDDFFVTVFVNSIFSLLNEINLTLILLMWRIG